MNEKSITKTTDGDKQENTGNFERFEKPYWGDTPKLTPEQIVEWLEGHREMMSLIKASNSPEPETTKKPESEASGRIRELCQTDSEIRYTKLQK